MFGESSAHLPYHLDVINPHPPVKVQLRFRLLAGALLKSCLEDLCRGDQFEQRLIARNAITWLRSISEEPGSFLWCCHVIDRDPDTLRQNGLPGLPGLKSWRLLRARRSARHKSDVKLTLSCPNCGKRFIRAGRQLFCSRQCASASRAPHKPHISPPAYQAQAAAAHA